MKVIDIFTERFLNEEITKEGIIPEELLEFFHLTKQRFGIRGFLDRTNSTFNLPWLKTIWEMPKNNECTKNFEEICVNRALELITEDKEIDIYWSGGIDSTAAISSFLLAGVRRDQLNIIYTNMSVCENPSFYLKVVSELKNECVNVSMSSPLLRENLVVTGECGDQLYSAPKSYIKKWIDTDPKFYSKASNNINLDWRLCPIYTKASDNLRDLIETLVSSAPFEIVGFADFWWWINFNTYWQNVSLRFGSYLDKDEFNIFMKLNRPFFNSNEFQSWAMNPDNSKYRSIYPERVPSRDIIRKVFNDESYYKYKAKIPSLPSNYKSKMIARLEDGTKISNLDEFIMFYRRYYV